MNRLRLLLFLSVLVVIGCSSDTDHSSADAETMDVSDARKADTTDISEADTTDTSSDATQDSLSTDTTVPAPTLAEHIAIDSIRAYQSVETTLVSDGAALEPDIPLVAGRDTLVQVGVEVSNAWQVAEITAEMVLTDTDDSTNTVLKDTRQIRGSSTQGDRSTLFQFVVDGDLLTPTTSVGVRLLGEGSITTDSATESSARWPRDGTTNSIGATDETGTLRLVLVPFRYNTDGSGRMPDTSNEQLAIIEDALRALYPAVRLRLEVREPADWSGYADFGDLNRELRDLKRQDGATFAYYYGMIRPAETFADYCSGTCTTGQSFTVSSAEATSYRVGSGVGFSGERWAWTLIHELGHMHGRGHAPCDVSWWSDDDNYPHSGGIIGVNAWDGLNDRLLGPNDATDFMGYCDNLWVSDYTYMGIFDRMAMANALQEPMSLAPKQTWRYVNWSDRDQPAWGRSTHERTPYSGEWATVVFVDEDGRQIAERRAPYVRYAHGGGRSVLVPLGPATATQVRIETTERTFQLAAR
ncbi:MAG: hypothetical protein ACQEVA_15600 [Myxococcota bacterium]